jgi:stage II sporulation protein M
MLKQLIQGLSDSLGSTSSSSGFFAVILLNNLITLVACFIFSPFLSIPPLLTLFLNGWLLSAFGYIIVPQESLAYYLAGILPHGIFEIPALILGQAAALGMGAMTIAAVIEPQKRGLWLPGLRKNIKYLFFALSLLIPAAIIETYLTPLLLNNL